ncbi:hypothetical protein MXB_3853, partial [Myxobolus squamalis]
VIKNQTRHFPRTNIFQIHSGVDRIEFYDNIDENIRSSNLKESMGERYTPASAVVELEKLEELFLIRFRTLNSPVVKLFDP